MKFQISILYLVAIILILLIGFWIVNEKNNETTDVEDAQANLAAFYLMEEICGKGNVADRCKHGYCDSELGLTCYSWRKAAHEAEQKVE